MKPMKFLLCKDREGNTKIIPNGAEVTAELKFEKGEVEGPITNGIYRKFEIYVLGSAVVDEVEGDRLAISMEKINFLLLFPVNQKLRLC